MTDKSLLKPAPGALALVVTMLSGGHCLAADTLAFQQHGSHVHGLANLQIAGEGRQLIAELRSPAINLAGFETTSPTNEQQAIVDSVLQALHEVSSVISLPEANCEVLEARALLEGANDHHDDHGHSHDHSHSHEHHHNSDTNHQSGHVEFHAVYEWRCDNAESISALSINLFSAYPGLETVQVQWILGNRQGAATASPGRHLLRF